MLENHVSIEPQSTDQHMVTIIWFNSCWNRTQWWCVNWNYDISWVDINYLVCWWSQHWIQTQNHTTLELWYNIDTTKSNDTQQTLLLSFDVRNDPYLFIREVCVTQLRFIDLMIDNSTIAIPHPPFTFNRRYSMGLIWLHSLYHYFILNP